jgi:DNA repair exonuclease SbcCD ATPase subunit
MGMVTLIKGGTGIGKTTLFQAIAWCLYGQIAVRNVTPNSSERSKTQVILEINSQNIIIDRRKNPVRLLVTKDNLVYEDKVAQSLINDIFGSFDVWVVSCYINQKSTNAFLTAPNSGKMELLNSIAFHEEDPNFYIERIQSAIEEITTEYNFKFAKFNSSLEKLTLRISEVDMTKELTIDEAEDLEKNLKILENKLPKLIEMKLQRNINLGILHNLDNQLKESKKDLTNLQNIKPVFSPLEINWKFDSTFEVGKIEILVNEINSFIPMMHKRDDLFNEILKTEKLLLPYSTLKNKDTYCLEDYQSAVAVETSYMQNFKQAQNLGVAYDQYSIKQAIESHKEILSLQDIIKKLKEQEELIEMITKLESQQATQFELLEIPVFIPKEILVPDYNEYSTAKLAQQVSELSAKSGSLETHLTHLKLNKDVIKCPHCQEPLRYNQGSLTKANAHPINLHDITQTENELTLVIKNLTMITENIGQLTNAEQEARKRYQQALLAEQTRKDNYLIKVKQIEAENQKIRVSAEVRSNKISILKENLLNISSDLLNIDNIPANAKLLTPKEIEEQRNTIAKLSNIKVVASPVVTSQHIQTCLNYQNLNKRKLEIEAQYNKLLEIIPILYRTESILTVNNYLQSLTLYQNKLKKFELENVRISTLIGSLEDQISKLTFSLPEDTTCDISSIEQTILQQKKDLSLNKIISEIKAFHKEVSLQRESLEQLSEQLSDYHTLKQCAIDTECRILQQVVDSVNISINDVCDTLFENDINVELSLYKTGKITKNIKPMVNFSIKYKGGVYDKIDQLSGGECDRCSLALTLALNRLSSCPILMLDETLSSLDLDMKEATIKTIRENTTNTVLIIMHDGIEGIFDNIIDMEELATLNN